MSIFRDTFQENIKKQLNTRQDLMAKEIKAPYELQYLNSRNAWIRMSSSVDVNNDKGKSAKENVLLGGTLLNNRFLRKGIGNTGNEAYSTKTSGGNNNKFGIRPMPGITNLNIQSKSAYGSLREITINWQCWDIKQLEELELLYMRPGYTVLVEWGWLPYISTNINNTKELIKEVPGFYDILDKTVTERRIIFKEIHDKCIASEGNYDAMFGYIKNYSWSARVDGGYDCQTIVISTGEIIESLKINYVRPDLYDLGLYDDKSIGKGMLDKEFGDQGSTFSINFRKHYEKNTLAGMWAEIYLKLTSGAIPYVDSVIYNSKEISLRCLSNQGSFGLSDKQIYLPLESVLELINNYIIAKSIQTKTKEPLISLSLYYKDTSDPLYCLSNPLQISLDPSVCLIKNPNWENTVSSVIQAIDPTVIQLQNNAKIIAKELSNAAHPKGITNFTDEQGLLNAIRKIDSAQLYQLVDNEIDKIEKTYRSIDKLILSELDYNDIKFYNDIISHLNSIQGITAELKLKQDKRKGLPIKDFIVTIDQNIINNINVIDVNRDAKRALNVLNITEDLNDFFYNDNNFEIGIIKNIYVNLDFLYKEATNSSIESSDPKEKNEINLYNYLKNIMRGVQESIGNLNNFEIHVDPLDNIARIIDINYTEPKKQNYDDLFELQVQNTKSIVRNYSLQSKIFPEQSSIVAIGAQLKGGQIGMQNNTLIDFNKGLIDRIIPEKGIEANLSIINNQTSVTANLSNIISVLSNWNNIAEDNADVKTFFNESKNNLRDLIVYIQTLTNSPSANRNIIPIKFSFTMDGIGGLIIGHLFKINEDVIPRGYKGTRDQKGNIIGSQLAQTITTIGHTISNNDWTTTIDALNIVLDNKKSSFDLLKINNIIKIAIESAIINSSLPKNLDEKAKSFGQIKAPIPQYSKPYLDFLAYVEGTAGVGQNGYNVNVGSTFIPNWNEQYPDHPDINIYIPRISNSSDAAGRYQFLGSTWKSYKKLGYNFGSIDQDKAGYDLLKNSAGNNNLKEAYNIAKTQILNNSIDVYSNKNFLNCLDKTYNIWASLVNSNGQTGYSNQGGRYNVGQLYAIYIKAIEKY